MTIKAPFTRRGQKVKALPYVYSTHELSQLISLISWKTVLISKSEWLGQKTEEDFINTEPGLYTSGIVVDIIGCESTDVCK